MKSFDRKKYYALLETRDEEDSDALLDGLDWFFSIFIVFSLIIFVLSTEKSIYDQYQIYFQISEWLTFLIFSLEYVLRVWSCVEADHLNGDTDFQKRLNFIKTPMMIVDLLSLLPFFLSLFGLKHFIIFTIFRIFRFFKLTRYSTSMSSLIKVLIDERRTLISCMLLILGLLLVASTSLYLVEKELQPDKFGSIPRAIWWSIITFGTVGYGDVVPISALGKSMTTLFVLVGVPIFALPVGIIATSYNSEINKKEFVVTWSMLSKVPIFSKLSPNEISEIIPLLYSKKFEMGEMISRKGDLANTMYFILRGVVEIQLEHKSIQLSTGDFFGEIALIEKKARQNNITALSICKMLLIDAKDFEILLKRNATIAKSIHSVALERSKISTEEQKHHPIHIL